MVNLGADQGTLQEFRELKKEDIKASTAILKPNTPGSTTLHLSWIWHDMTGHILPGADADLSSTDAETILECMSPSYFYLFLSSYILVKRVHWLRARAQKNRWQEECILVRYEMEWVVRYFVHKSQFWQSAQSGDSPGPAAYATRKAAMWRQLARFADGSFKNININYKSPL